MKKKMITAGLAAGLLAGTGAGLILEMAGSAGAASNTSASAAAEDDTDTTTAAGDTGTGTDADRPDPSARLQEVLQPLVDDGTLTQAQLDSVIATLSAAGPMGGGGGHGPRGGGRGLETVATTLGMTVEEVRDAISNGQTLAQLAEAKGSTAQALIDAIVAEVKAHLDEEVASGEHTQEEADLKLLEAVTRATEFVNNTQEAGPMGGEGGPGHHGPGTDDAAGTDSGAPIDGGPADSATDTTGA